MRTWAGVSLALGMLMGVAAESLADDVVQSDDARRIEALERRVAELEGPKPEATVDETDAEAVPSSGERADWMATAWTEWTRRVRISGSANLGVYGGQADSVVPNDGFDAWDTRFFVDAELDEEIAINDVTLIRNIGFSFEWNLVRLGMLTNDVGSLYVDFQGLGGSSWANLRAGRFLIPVGEAYKRYGKGYADKPFIYNTLGGPWWWDEGFLLYGGPASDRFGYLASVTNGDTPFNGDFNQGVQTTLKLWAKPLPQLTVSVSGLWSNDLGAVDGALWLGETWARPFGSGSGVPNVIHANVVPDDTLLGQTWLIAGDVIWKPTDWLRFWLAGGRYAIDSQASSSYDRTLYYWIAEAIADGGFLSPALSKVYVGFRAEGLGTYDADRGYLLDVRYGSTLGYDMESYSSYGAVVGWKLGRFVTLRAEYAHRNIDLVSGAGAVVFGGSNRADVYAVEVGVHF